MQYVSRSRLFQTRKRFFSFNANFIGNQVENWFRLFMFLDTLPFGGLQIIFLTIFQVCKMSMSKTLNEKIYNKKNFKSNLGGENG